LYAVLVLQTMDSRR